MRPTQKSWHVIGHTTVIATLLLLIFGSIVWMYSAKSEQVKQQQAAALQRQLAEPKLPPHSVRSELNPDQYLKVNLPQNYFNRPYQDNEFDKKFPRQGNRYLFVYAIIEIEGDKITLKPREQQRTDSSNVIFVFIRPVSKTEKRLQEHKRQKTVSKLKHAPLETPHLQVQLTSKYSMALQPKNFKNSQYDPFFINISRGENPKSDSMFRDSFSINTMIKNENYVIDYHITFSRDFIPLIRRGSPYQLNEANNFMERLFVLSNSDDTKRVLQMSDEDLQAFVRLNNEVVGLIDQHSVIEHIAP